MEQIFLAIVFIINSKPVFLPGWLPLEQSSIEVCNERKRFVIDYITNNDLGVEFGGVYCGTQKQIQKQIDSIEKV